MLSLSAVETLTQQLKIQEGEEEERGRVGRGREGGGGGGGRYGAEREDEECCRFSRRHLSVRMWTEAVAMPTASDCFQLQSEPEGHRQRRETRLNDTVWSNSATFV
ncbi:hypothetical protein PAMA_017719 [Pampus argenteus]